MKSTGIVRKIDSLGRIVIPKELRDNMNIHKQDEVVIFVNHNEIIIKKFKVTCIFCGSNENIIDFKNQNICEECLANIIKTDEIDKEDKEDEVDEVDEVRDDSHSQKDDSFFDKIINFFKKD